jgi:regulator of protease activity HflC (stomatin/prohibitin superfamily)
MRETVTTRPLDEVTQGREAIALAMKPAVEAEFKRLGHVLLSLDVRDLVLPGDLRKAMNAVHAARLEGQAKLEKARAESATLRNLANAARLAAETPALLQLRALQAVEASGGTVVLGGNPSPN